MQTLLATDGVKTLVEKAISNLLSADDVLSALIPTLDETYIDAEPTAQDEGLTRNPQLSVKATGGGTAVKQTGYRTYKVEVTVKLEPDEETKLTGIAPYFRRVESVLDSPELHITINAANNEFFICVGTLDRNPGDPTIENGWHIQTYSFSMIAIANPGYLS